MKISYLIVFIFILQSVNALYILQQPIAVTVYDNGAPFYAPDTQMYSGYVIAYDPTDGTGISTDNLDKGLNPYYQGNDSYVDTTFGSFTFQDFCYDQNTLIEGLDASFVNVLAPIQSATNPQWMFFVAVNAPAGTICTYGKFAPPEFAGYPLTSPYSFAPGILHTGHLTGDTVKDLAFAAPVQALYATDTAAGQLFELNTLTNTCNPLNQLCQYSGLALANIDQNSFPSNALEILGNQDELGVNQLESYSRTTNSFAITPGYPLLNPVNGVGYGNSVVAGDINNDGLIEMIKVGEYPSIAGNNLMYNTNVNVLSAAGASLPSFPVTFSRIAISPPNGNYWFLPSPSEEVALIPDANNPLNKNIVLVSQGFLIQFNPVAPQIRVIDGNGQTLPGWPVSVPGKERLSAPVVGDIDGGGDYEIVVLASGGSYGGAPIPPNLYAFKQNGVVVPGFPVNTGNVGGYAEPPGNGLSLADLDGDGKKEIIVSGAGAIVYGTGVMTGFPLTLNRGGGESLIADITGDNIPEIIYSAGGCYYISGQNGCHPNFGAVYAIDTSGNIVPGFPITVASGHGAPAITLEDIDGDNLVELVVVEGGGAPTAQPQIHIYRTIGSVSSVRWATFQHDAQNTGFAP